MYQPQTDVICTILPGSTEVELENTELIIQYFASIKIELSHTVLHENSSSSRVIVCVRDQS